MATKPEEGDYILLDEVLESTRWIDVEVAVGDKIKVIKICYDPSKFTPELEATINASNPDLLGDSFIGLLVPLFVDWSIKLPPLKDKSLLSAEEIEAIPKDQLADYEPRDWPPTEENLRKMPFPRLALFTRAIMGDVVPKEQNTRR